MFTRKAVMTLMVAATLALALNGCSAEIKVSTTDSCAFSAPRDASVTVGNARRIVIRNTVGEVKVYGKAGATDVRATGKACATQQSYVDESKLTATLKGDEIQVTGETPRVTGVTPTLLLSIEVPDNLPVFVENGSGTVEVTQTASVELRAESGTATLQKIAGDVTVARKGSGLLTIREVGGNVIGMARIGSGSLIVERVKGNVNFDEKESGTVNINGVDGSVFFKSIASGTLDVRNVKGDLTVKFRESGMFIHDNIGGKIEYPKVN